MRLATLAVFAACACTVPPPATADEVDDGESEAATWSDPAPPPFKTFTGPDGARAYSFRCNGPGDCLQRAGALCPNGYDVLGAESVQAPIVAPRQAEPNTLVMVGCSLQGLSAGSDPVADELAQRRVDECFDRERRQAQEAENLRAAQAQARILNATAGAREVVVKCTEPPPAAVVGVLRVTAEPESVVFVDGQQVGRTPMTLEVSLGPHLVRVENSLGFREVRVPVSEVPVPLHVNMLDDE